MAAPSTAPPPSSSNETDDFPLAAQIPLSSFTLPPFPPTASHLRSLTLTSDIDLKDYQPIHLKPGTFEPPPPTLPHTITHLTLELFSLGFPPPFLSTLASRIPKLHSLTLFSTLLDGLTDPTRADALSFFRATAPTLREVHVIDTFTRPGFWTAVANILDPQSQPQHSTNTPTATANTGTEGLTLLTISTTYRGHHEPDFLSQVPAEEYPSLITPSLIGLSLSFSSPPPPGEALDDTNDLDTSTGTDTDTNKGAAVDGILPFASDGRATNALRKRFESLRTGLTNLRVLNLDMYTLTAHDVIKIVDTCGRAGRSRDNEEGAGLADLTVSILLEEGWFGVLVDGLTSGGGGAARNLEGIEVVGVPSLSSEVCKTDVDERVDVAVAEKMFVQSRIDR